MSKNLIERLLGGQPILEARPQNAWESKVVLNPAADLVEIQANSNDVSEHWDLSDRQRNQLRDAGAACVILYRAQGAPDDGHDVAPSSIGLAVFTPDFELVKRWDHPVIRPDAPYRNLGVEDPRITRVGNTWHMYYTAYGGDPGKAYGDSREIKICHAATANFVDWIESGPIPGALNDRPNKNAALLPETVGGKWILLHRPMEGPGAMTIHYAMSDRPDGPWDDRGVLMRGLDRPDCSRAWVGAGGPPLALGGGRFLMIYHRGAFDLDDQREYDLGAAILDFRSGADVQGRIEPIMSPYGRLEQKGDPDVGVDNVLFTCANFTYGDDRLVIPYAGADSRIFVATASLSGLVADIF